MRAILIALALLVTAQAHAGVATVRLPKWSVRQAGVCDTASAYWTGPVYDMKSGRWSYSYGIPANVKAWRVLAWWPLGGTWQVVSQKELPAAGQRDGDTLTVTFPRKAAFMLVQVLTRDSTRVGGGWWSCPSKAVAWREPITAKASRAKLVEAMKAEPR